MLPSSCSRRGAIAQRKQVLGGLTAAPADHAFVAEPVEAVRIAVVLAARRVTSATALHYAALAFLCITVSGVYVTSKGLW